MDDKHSPSLELQDLSQDPEQQAPPRRRSTWFSKSVDEAGTEPTPQKAERSNSGRVTTSLSIFVGWISHPNGIPTIEAPVSETSGGNTPIVAGPPQDIFICAVTGKGPKSDGHGLTMAYKWYIEYLESKIREAWIPLFRRVLLNIRQYSDVPNGHDIATAFEFFTAVVLAFGRKDLALVEIVDEVYNKGLLKDSEDEDDERSAANQLVFAAIGWISHLYSPSTNPEENSIQIADQTIFPGARNRKSSRRNSRFKSKTFVLYKQPLDSKDLPLHTLLGRFGKVVPAYDKAAFSSQDTSNTPGRYDGWIDPLLVCFHTLNKCTSIKVQWVDCLSLHLEFDSRTKILKLFRFPSLCLLMCASEENHPSLMARIFQDSATSSDICYESFRTEIEDTREFFKEVLLSYRLIFGQTKNSHRDFNRQFRKWSKHWRSTTESQKQMDHLLQIICGNHWQSSAAGHIWDEIEAEDPANIYSPTTDFPFFGERLIELQSYVRGHNFMALWYDRRDVSWWWTFWAVIIIGGATLILALLQSVLQIMQVVLAQKQLDQGSSH